MQKLKNKELNRLNNDEFKIVNKFPVTIILDNIRSMNNVGSVFRTADAFRIEQIFLCGITAKPPHKEIHKTALGATNTVKWEHFKSTLEAIKILKQNGYKIIAIEQAKQSTMLNSFNLIKEKIAIIFGNEVNGVSNEAMQLADECIEIPQFGTKHSLNISVSVGVVVWHFFYIYKRNNLSFF